MNPVVSKGIKAIDREAVHRICSGQVVLNLATAVKELVENSLDAGATVIEVRLKEFGSEIIEITDNGCGVEPENFEGLTLKHHTSKLQDFSDLMSVETFGFRGEALSSLCALSELSVTTRHQNSSCGTHLVFDRNGHITSSTPVARQVGTTVCLENVFGALPVRQKEFHRNLKREFAKMTQLLYAYCLVSTDVRITCTNQTKKSGRTTIIATQGCKSVRENIACVFGTKQLSSLLELSSENISKKMSAETLEELGLSEQDLSMFEIKGFVSSCAHGQGRGATDRQFYFINSRPCEPTKVMKIVSEVYHQYNQHQHPFVFLNVIVARDCVDINVTPDKRQIFMEHEKLLVHMVKTILLGAYETIPSTYTMNNISVSLASSPKKNLTTSLSPAALLSQWRHSRDKRSAEEAVVMKPVKQMCLDTIFSSQKEKSLKHVNGFIGLTNKTEDNVNMQNDFITDSSEKIEDEIHEEREIKAESTENNVMDQTELHTTHDSPNKNDISVTVDFKYLENKILNTNIEMKELPDIKELNSLNSKTDDIISAQNLMRSDLELGNSMTNDYRHLTKENELENVKVDELIDVITTPDCNDSELVNNDLYDETIVNSVDTDCVESKMELSRVLVDLTEAHEIAERKSTIVDLTMEKLHKISLVREEKRNQNEKGNVRFRAVIDPSKNKQAEQELSREITKDMFSEMEVLGQFNLGFIIARLGSDLFIVDQHATDEKFNFETLQQTTTLSNQKLVVPQHLDLTAINECILVENLHVFRANGFEFKIDETAPVTKKISLTAIPMSRNWTFGKEDIDELLFMLQDAPHTLCRPSRVRAMFASRACRKSVMIGTALSYSEMKRLLVHMGEIEQPWNCPHGRPTMRHLINLDFI